MYQESEVLIPDRTCSVMTHLTLELAPMPSVQPACHTLDQLCQTKLCQLTADTKQTVCKCIKIAAAQKQQSEGGVLEN